MSEILIISELKCLALEWHMKTGNFSFKMVWIFYGIQKPDSWTSHVTSRSHATFVHYSGDLKSNNLKSGTQCQHLTLVQSAQHVQPLIA